MTEQPELLSPGQVAAMFAVGPRTVTRWADQGVLSHIRTPGGHRRYDAEEVRALRDKEQKWRRADGVSTDSTTSAGSPAPAGDAAAAAP